MNSNLKSSLKNTFAALAFLTVPFAVTGCENSGKFVGNEDKGDTLWHLSDYDNLEAGMILHDPSLDKKPLPQTRLILDVDTGRDDAWTILGALEKFEVIGIIASYGNIPLSLAVDNTLSVLELGVDGGEGISENETDVPVYLGAAAPLFPATPEAVAEIERRASIGGNGIANLTRPREIDTARLNGGITSLAEQIRAQHGRPLTYIVCGPMTNLAQLIDEFGFDPETGAPLIRRHIGRVVAMGGSFDPDLPVDFNFKADPRAAQLVIETFGESLILVPFDETRKLRLERAQLDVLKPASEDGGFSQRLMIAHADGWSQDGSILLHDPATLLAAEPLQPAAGVAIRIEQEGARAGKVIVDPFGTTVQRFIIPAGLETTLRDRLLNNYLDLTPPPSPTRTGTPQP